MFGLSDCVHYKRQVGGVADRIWSGGVTEQYSCRSHMALRMLHARQITMPYVFLKRISPSVPEELTSTQIVVEE